MGGGMGDGEAAVLIQGLFRTRHARRRAAGRVREIWEKAIDEGTGL
jgi:hypothetical protein